MNDKPIKYCREFYKTKFKGKNMKDAYLRACKWYATNVLSKDELQNVYAEYEKDPQSPTITIHLYATLTEELVKDEHCRICKDVSKSFLCGEETKCNECKLRGYHNRLEQRMETKSLYYRELIDRSWE